MARIVWAVLVSWVQCKSVVSRLGLTKAEGRRFCRKTRNLTLCYLAFCQDKSLVSVKKCAMAAVCCAAYDVLSDWRGFSDSNRQLLGEIITVIVGKELADIALDLYDKEVSAVIGDDGLERGYDSIQFITQLLGSRDFIEKQFDLKRLGMALQVVDDILDYEDDLCKGELNCLASPRWKGHLDLMEAELNGQRMAALYSHGWLLGVVIRHAMKKAKLLRRTLLNAASPMIAANHISENLVRQQPTQKVA